MIKEKTVNFFDNEKFVKAFGSYFDKSSAVEQDMLEEIFDTLSYIKMDDESIVSAFLYALVPKNELNFDELKVEFGDEVVKLVKALNAVDGEHTQENNFNIDDIRSMLFAMAKDVRVLIILLSNVLYKMKNINLVFAKESELKKNVFVKAVDEIYAPLSGRLGLNEIKNQLEDMCFRYLDPNMYVKLTNEEILNKEIRQTIVDDTIAKLNEMVREMGLNATVMGRQKHIASVYKKMKTKEVTLAQIYDLVAVRVIVDSVEECYSVLGKINTSFQILPERFKDYIAMPKQNGYQSLHTCIIGLKNRPVEVQIRTKEMHRYNEYGVAAHWVYKEHKSKSDEIDTKMNWFRRVIEENKDFTDKEFIENIKTDLFVSEIFVQTPNGKIIKFPIGANCIDFAYSIHSDIGNKCVGSKINGKLCPLYSKLQNGDICEILTSNTSKGPSRDWLKEVRTSSARSKISAFFKHEFVEENIKTGKTILERLAKDNGTTIGAVLISEKLKSVFNKFSVESIEELYAGIGHGSINGEKVISRLIEKPQQKRSEPNIVPKNEGKGIVVAEQHDMLTRFAKCCTPIPGDKIIGFVSRGKGVTIHRADCKNIKYLEKERLIDAEWASKNSQAYRTRLRVLFDNDHLAITNVSTVLDKASIQLLSLESKVLANGHYEIFIEVSVPTTKALTGLVDKLKSIPGVISSNRMS